MAYSRRQGYDVGYGVAVALKYPSLKPVACVAVARIICIPYIPGLLAFREMSVLAPAISKLMASTRIDVIVADGHGIAHPRGAGIATHIGVAFNTPSIGIAKKRLYGRETKANGKLYLEDPKTGRRLAAILFRGKRKVYVSPGHRITVDTAARLVERTWVKPPIPEPTRTADLITKRLKKLSIQPETSDPVYLDCATIEQ